MLLELLRVIRCPCVCRAISRKLSNLSKEIFWENLPRSGEAMNDRMMNIQSMKA